MINLSDVNDLTNSFDGSIFSDMHKDIYGVRPHNISFSSVEVFDKELKNLYQQYDEYVEREQQNTNVVVFEERIDNIMISVSNIDRIRAIEILADSWGELEYMQAYGYEWLETLFDIEYGYIQKSIS